MSQRYLGGIITANPTAPTLASASGVWTLEQQFQYSQTIQPERIGNSLRFRASASAYMNRTNSSTVTNNKIFTYSLWIKRGSLGITAALLSGDNSTAQHYFGFGVASVAADSLEFYDAQTAAWRITTNALYRDPSAWYHVLLSVDTTQATAANRVRIYVNGTECSYATANYPAQDTVPNINVASMPLYIGRRSNVSQWYFDGYMAETYFIDGQALTPSSFGGFDTNGIWQPLPYTGTYGTNGFYLTFADNSGATATTIGKDYSGNGNNWTPNNISVTSGTTYDWMLDTPTNSDNGGTGRGNYAVLNPLTPAWYVASIISNGNLQLSTGSDTAGNTSTIAMRAGKFYWENIFSNVTVSNACGAGIHDTSTKLGGSNAWSLSGNWVLGDTGLFYANGASGVASGTGTFSSGDVANFAFDADTGKLWVGKNGTWVGDPAAGTGQIATVTMTGKEYDALSTVYGAGSTLVCNFGQRPFAYTPPTGFKALNTQNMPSVNINNGAQYMAATLYTGTGSTQSISNGANNPIGTTFQPDLVWLKSRSNAQQNNFYDVVRGISSGGSPTIFSDSTSAEVTYAGYGVSALNSNGFSVIGNGGLSNQSTYTYVGWQWKAGGTAVSNTAGSITSSVSANTTAGFSIVSYTGNGTNGATVGHGLGVQPWLIIEKGRSTAYNWSVQGCGKLWATATSNLFLNTTGGLNAGGAYGAPNSTTFYPSLTNYANESGVANIAYCFAPVAGYSAFGSYTGNGSADGPFVYCGFRPRFVMIKDTTAGGSYTHWFMFDSSRNTYNYVQENLEANLSDASGSGNSWLDFTSNGFKLRLADTTYRMVNWSGDNYIFAAFAENPFNISRAR